MQTILFLNGKIPARKIVNKFLTKNHFIIAADGAAEYLRKTDIVPDLIIGDLDSIKRKTIKYFLKKKTIIKKIENQDYTDFEKCLMYCLKNGNSEITVFGATSMRPDHTLNNYSILKRYYKKLNVKFITDQYEIRFIGKNFNLRYKKDEVISLLGIPKASKITTSGMQYELNGEDLEFGVREGTLNRSVSENISISFEKGNILLFTKHFIK